MATSRSLLLSAVLSGLVFSAAALPLAILGSRPITVEIEGKPLLTGRVQDLASSYMGLVLGLSAGVGLITLSLSEWRNTSRKLNKTLDRVSSLEHQLRQQESQVERLKFSESRLQSQGLNFFLDPAEAVLPAEASSAPFTPINHTVSSHTVSSHTVPNHTSLSPVNAPNQATPQIEEVMSALKQLMNQVEQLKSPAPSNSIDHTMAPSVNASIRA